MCYAGRQHVHETPNTKSDVRFPLFELVTPILMLLKCRWHKNFVSCGWISKENVLKLYKCWKNVKSIFFFKICTICLQICPGDWDIVYHRQSYLWHHIVYLCHTWCCIEVRNVTSHSIITCDFGRAMTRTNVCCKAPSLFLHVALGQVR